MAQSRTGKNAFSLFYKASVSLILKPGKDTITNLRPIFLMKDLNPIIPQSMQEKKSLTSTTSLCGKTPEESGARVL